MEINIKLNKNFTTAFNKMQNEYGEELARLNGFSDAQLSYTDFIDNFVDKQTVADASIDGNSNVSHKDIVTLENEMSKPHSKLLVFHKIYYELNKKYGFKVANDWLKNEWDGHFYLHDGYNASFKSYCFAYDIEKLVTHGLYFIENFNSQPPKHLNTYTDFVGEFVSWTCNRSSGAVGLPSFLIYSYYFWKKDCESGYTSNPEQLMKQEFQRIVYKLNQPYLRSGVQSAFTNFSIFDRPYLESLFGGKEFPDGTFVIDYIDEIIEYQKQFMEVVSEIRSQNMMTFPVLTYALLRQNGKFNDEEFAMWCCNHNMKWADSNFFISGDVTSLSNCCFAGSQNCLTKSSNGVNYLTFKELYDANYNKTKRNFTIFHNGSWLKGKIVKLPKRKMYKIITSNKKEMIVTDNHIIPTLNGDKYARDITSDDYLMFSNRKLDSFPEQDKKLTYEQGFLIGMYLGDGSVQQNKESYTPTIHLSLNKHKYESSCELVNRALSQLDVNAKFTLNKPYNNVYPTTIRSNIIFKFIKEYVHGDYCFKKELDLNCLLQSYAFRKGILEGYYITDGGNSNRIYTTSKNLSEQIEVLITSLGFNSVIDITDRTDEPVVIREEKFKRNYSLYCIRWYDAKNKCSRSDIFRVKNNSEYFKVKTIESCNYDDEFVYCFEMENQDEPYFTLPNGSIHHNCRLISDITQVNKQTSYFNSIGGTALEVGSIKVNTINLARISYESKTVDDYIMSLKEKVVLCLQALDVVRHIIKRNVEKGLLPNYSLEIMNLSSQYNTIGIIGVYEALQKFGLTIKDKFDNTIYTDEGIAFAERILKTITEVKDEFASDKDYSINIEEVPAERAAAVLMEKDKFFYPNQEYELPLYGNQWIPLGIKTTLQEKIKLSALLDKACSGGSIAHINLDAPFTNFDVAWKMLNYVADAGVVYFAFCTKISACKNNHGFYGDTCPHCGEPVQTTYQRVVGFLTPTSTYSNERKKEFLLRDWMELDRMSEL